MASNKKFKTAPILLTTTTTTNLLNPPTTTGGTNAGTPNPYILITHMRVGNVTSSAATFATWIGTTGVNTIATNGPFPGQASAGALTQGLSVPANSYVDWYGSLPLETADFLVGGASAANALVLIAEGEIGIR